MRWKGFITLIVISVLVAVTGIFLLDDIIEMSVEKAGSKLWGAKIEIENTEVSWSPFGIKINDFTIASKKDEFKNLVDIEAMEISVETAPLLEKKTIINEISGKGLAFNTSRDESGFLPEKEKKQKSKDKESEDTEKDSKWKLKMSSWMEDIKKRGREKIDVKGSFKKEELESFKAINAAEESLKGLKDKYKEFKKLNVNETIALVTEKTKALEGIKINELKDIKEAKKKIDDAKTAIEKVDTLKGDIGSTVKELETSVSGISSEIKEIDAARKRDYRNLMDKLKLPSIEMDDIAETVFGSLVTEKFNKFLYYAAKIRKYLPPKKKKTMVVKTRGRGKDIVFPKEKSYPPLHVKKAVIDGEKSARIDGRDFSTTPWIIGKPAVINAIYNGITLETVIDRTGDIPTESIKGSVNSFKLAGATGTLNMATVFEGDKISSVIDWSGKGLMPENWLEYLNLKDPEVTVGVKVSGKKDSLNYAVESNLDRIISDQLKKELTKKIKEAKREINSLVDKNVLGRKKNLEKDIKSFKNEKVSYLNSEKKKLEEKKRELEDKIEKKKKEAEGLVEQKKTEAEDKIKKGTDKLKKLFK